MIAIIDSGSTKSDWVLLDENKIEIFRTETIGFNPNFIDKEQIIKELNKNTLLVKQKNVLTSIYFYGSGCSSNASKNIIKGALSFVFKKATVKVEHDLLAAAYSAYFGNPAIICILGTGSNSCYFDGENIQEKIPSLGYILSDYGSGSYLGKKLLSAFAENKLEPLIVEELKQNHQLSIKNIIENIYKKPLPNKYLASFNPFIYKHRSNSFIEKMIYDSIKDFFEIHIKSYSNFTELEVNFIGSIADCYQETIYLIAKELNINVAHIVSKPIDNLVDFHKKYT